MHRVLQFTRRVPPLSIHWVNAHATDQDVLSVAAFPAQFFALLTALRTLQSWHPTERMLAVAAENTMYIHAEADGRSA